MATTQATKVKAGAKRKRSNLDPARKPGSTGSASDDDESPIDILARTVSLPFHPITCCQLRRVPTNIAKGDCFRDPAIFSDEQCLDSDSIRRTARNTAHSVEAFVAALQWICAIRILLLLAASRLL